MIQFTKRSRRGLGLGQIYGRPPLLSPKRSFILFPASLPQTSNTLTFGREKNTSFDSILQRLYLQKNMKKIPFPGRRQRREREPGKLLLIHAKLHSQHRTVFLFVFHPFHTAPTSNSHTKNIYTHTHYPVPSIQLTHTFQPEKHPSFHVLTQSSASIFGCVVPITYYWPTLLCHQSWRQLR